MAHLSFKNIEKSFNNYQVLQGIDLEIESGQFIVFLGPSGCGKSTLLRIIAGLEQPSGGTIEIDGRPITGVPASQREIAMVFQSYALYPHMTVRQNMGFGLRIAGLPKQKVEDRIMAAAKSLQLVPYLDRFPRELSGGQRQRVAIGRAITRDPKVFLFDEPLSNLDAALRVATRVEIASLHERLSGTTMIYVTHDQVEAMTLADKIVVLNGGKVEQFGTPLEVYKSPANLFVAGFIGSAAMNILDGHASGQSISVEGGRGLALGGEDRLTGKCHIGVRPEDLQLCDDDTGLFHGTVSFLERLGDTTLIYLRSSGDRQFIVKVAGDVQIERYSKISVSPLPGAIHVFDDSGVRRFSI